MREGKKKKSTVLGIRAIHQQKQERKREREKELLLGDVYFNKIQVPTNTTNGWLIQNRAYKKVYYITGFCSLLDSTCMKGAMF